MKTVIEIEKLGYSYGEGWILNDLSLKIEQGDFVAVIGPNGAGKSTLLRLLAGILKPAQGRIAIFGQDRENFTAWDKIGYVPQNPARQHRAFPISVREVVSLGRLSGGSMFQHYTHEDKAAVDDIIERFSLKELAHRKIGELSGGQRPWCAARSCFCLTNLQPALTLTPKKNFIPCLAKSTAGRA